MVMFCMQIRICPEFQTEFLQAYHDVLRLIRREKGCISCRLSLDTEDPTLFSLQGEWDNRENLERYLRTDQFRVLIGAARTLSGDTPPTLNISGLDTSFQPTDHQVMS